MTPNRLIALFDRISGAPDAIPRLRRFILDLAVRGKLVEQDPNDESVSDLLSRVAAGNSRRSGRGPRVRAVTAPNLSDNEMPFALPSGWSWTRFEEIADFSAGRTPSRNDLSFWNTGDHAWVSISDMRDGGCVVATKETVSERARTQVFRAEPVPAGTLLMSFKLTIGKIARLGIPAYHNEAIIAIQPRIPGMDSYLLQVLPQFARAGATKDAVKGATLNRESLANILVPSPPLAEQHRIVARVDELMALCDQLEAAQAAREAQRGRVAAASLQRLNEPADDAAEFREHVSFHLSNLPRLVTRPEHIPALRQTILNLAVRGKLLPQDPSDEPAKDLVARISAEKRELLKGNRAKLRESEPEIMSSEAVPSSWVSIALGDLMAGSFYGPRFGADEYSQSGIPTIRTTDMTTDGRIVLRDPPRVSVPAGRLADFRCEQGDLLVTRTGSIGTMAVFRGDYDAIPSAYLIRLRFTASLCVEYIHCALRSSAGLRALGLGMTKMAQPNINAKTLAGITLPLPPLPEQHRIVNKVNELFAICDELGGALARARDESRRLLEAVLLEALAPAAHEPELTFA